MKKWIILLLLPAVLLSITACGGKNGSASDKEFNNSMEIDIFNPEQGLYETEEPGFLDKVQEMLKPTEEELEELEIYEEILEILEYYADSRVFFENIDLTNTLLGINQYKDYELWNFYPDGVQYSGLGNIYHVLLKLESVDKWVGTPYAPSKDRREVLNNFYILNDVLLSETEMEMMEDGRVGYYEMNCWWYDNQGRIDGVHVHGNRISTVNLTDPINLLHHLIGPMNSYGICNQYIYDDSGKLTGMQCDGYRSMEFIYDEKGRIKEEIWVNYEDTIPVTLWYDDQDRLTEVHIEDEETYILEFIRDASGKVVIIDSHAKPGKIELQYDEAGRLVQIDVRYEERVFDGHVTRIVEKCRTWQMTHDEQGRVISTVYYDDYRYYEFAMTYGDFYGYDPS